MSNSPSPSPSREESSRIEYPPRPSISRARTPHSSGNGSRDMSPSTFVPPSVSLLSARRPSWTPVPLLPLNLERDNASNHAQVNGFDSGFNGVGEEEGEGVTRGRPTASRETSVSGLKQGFLRGNSGGDEEDGTFWQSLQIDMKDLIGDAVGNMSIAPSSRDIALGARRGLFIIDLESPGPEVPRFLPQGGTWDVADVQWNPHPSHANYIISTSSEKLLIWNLYMGGKTSIEYILKSHYRAITDINWHNSDPDVVVSTGLDSWLWAWDLRTTDRPIFGFSVFNSGGTQVKWSRKDPHILASSHMSEVLIWDRRKGSVPVSRIAAHDAKIYGIDWAHNSRTELLTCSLDKTIKVWDIHKLESEDVSQRSKQWGDPLTIESPLSFLQPQNSKHLTPQRVIRTAYPVWRARDLPFGRGVLSLPQRGETTLEMFGYDADGGEEGGKKAPVEVFEGHKDVVKEYVWRRGGIDGGSFQLITWSKDKTLRFWPVDADTMQRAGATPGSTVARLGGRGNAYLLSDKTRSFRDPPKADACVTAFSAPVGNRSILAEVRAQLPDTARPFVNPILLPHQGSGARAIHEHEGQDGGTGSPILRFVAGAGGGVGPRARGRGKGAGARSRTTGFDESGSVTVKGSLTTPTHTRPVPTPKTETMSRGGFGGRSARVDALQWLSSVRRVGERRDDSGSGADSTVASRMGSRERGEDGERNRSGSGTRKDGRSLSHVRGEDERRDVEDGNVLQDEITSVVSKLASHKVRLEKHDLTRRRTCTIGLHGPWGEGSSVFIRITFTFPREYPFNEPPLGTPTVDLERNPLISTQSRAFILRGLRKIRERQRPCLEACLRFLLGVEPGSREDRIEADASSDEDGHRSKDPADELNADRNFAEPRTSQGVFSPNGRLVCFFRAPPRLVKNVSVSLSITSRARETILSNAVRHLTLATRDSKASTSAERREGPEDEANVLRIMNSLLTFAHSRRFPDQNVLSPPSATPTRSETPLDAPVPSPISSPLVQSPLRTTVTTTPARTGDKKGKNYAVLTAPRLSTVYITHVKTLEDLDRSLGEKLIVDIETVGPIAFCGLNAEAALGLGRRDLQRVFKSLATVCVPGAWDQDDAQRQSSRAPWYLAKQIIERLYAEYSSRKDVQMLAMISILVLSSFQAYLKQTKPRTSEVVTKIASPPVASTASPRSPAIDYFSLRRRKDSRTNNSSPAPRFPSSPTTPSRGIALSSSLSSRGSWSSLFNAGTVRQFMAGVQDSFSTPMETPSGLTLPIASSAVSIPPGLRIARPRQISAPKSKSSHDPTSIPNSNAAAVAAAAANTSKSWSESQGGQPSSSKLAVTFSSAGNQIARHPTFSQVVIPKIAIPEKFLTFTIDQEKAAGSDMELFSPDRVKHFICHVEAYADVLLTWELFEKRLELLRSLHQVLEVLGLAPQKPVPGVDASGRDPLRILVLCSRCKSELNSQGERLCPSCLGQQPSCTICRLPVNGLAHTCMFCFHLTHLKCWKTHKMRQCPSGCGCFCDSTTELVSPPTSPPLVSAVHLAPSFLPFALTYSIS